MVTVIAGNNFYCTQSRCKRSCFYIVLCYSGLLLQRTVNYSTRNKNDPAKLATAGTIQESNLFKLQYLLCSLLLIFQ